jgi:hypothetical protein
MMTREEKLRALAERYGWELTGAMPATVRRGSRLGNALEEAWEVSKPDAVAGTLTGEAAILNGRESHLLFWSEHAQTLREYLEPD